MKRVDSEQIRIAGMKKRLQMTNNYRNHLRYELRDAVEAASRLADDSSRRETRWLRATDRRKHCEQQLAQLRKAESEDETRFRAAHGKHMEARGKIGEIEEELFSFGEDSDDWFH